MFKLVFERCAGPLDGPQRIPENARLFRLPFPGSSVGRASDC